jgi:hypothetical protein
MYQAEDPSLPIRVAFAPGTNETTAAQVVDRVDASVAHLSGTVRLVHYDQQSCEAQLATPEGTPTPAAYREILIQFRRRTPLVVEATSLQPNRVQQQQG